MNLSAVSPSVGIMLHLLYLTQIACILAVVGGVLYRRFCRNSLPPVPTIPGAVFPNVFDLGYTLFFSVLTVLTTTSMIFQGDCFDVKTVNAGSMILSTLAQSLFYLPFLVRFARLPMVPRPAWGVCRVTLCILLALGGIIIPFKLLECSGFFQYIIEQTACPEFQSVVIMFRDGDWALRAAVAGAAVIMAPICEEVVYRGFVYRILRHYSGRTIAILLSAMLFSVIHGALVQAMPLFIFGVVQCLVYEKSRTIWLPIAIHAIYNSLSLVMILLS